MFKPYVGKDFQNQKIKILFCGESHYLESKSIAKEDIDKHGHFIGTVDENTTVSAIEGWLNDEYTMRFFSVIHSSFKKYFQDAEKKDFYNKIAFANYIQNILINPRAGILPFIRNDEIYKTHFMKIVEDLQPTHIILFSSRLKPLFDYNGISDYLGRRLVSIAHPSGRGFVIKDIQREFEQYL